MVIKVCVILAISFDNVCQKSITLIVTPELHTVTTLAVIYQSTSSITTSGLQSTRVLIVSHCRTDTAGDYSDHVIQIIWRLERWRGGEQRGNLVVVCCHPGLRFHTGHHLTTI